MMNRQAIGIDFGGTTIKTALVEESRIVARGPIIATRQAGGREEIMRALAEIVADLRTPQTAALGIGLPGIVDGARGVVHELSNVPGWNEVPLRGQLAELTGLPVTIENDANAMAYAEWKFGAAGQQRNVVCVTLGTGVGGGLILNGELYRGSGWAAGEIGQMSIDFRGPPDHYGTRGSLEQFVGNHLIAERAAALYGGAKTPADCPPAALALAAENGDPIARQLWQNIGEEIGAALVNVVWLLNPDCLVIGGGIAQAGALLFDPISATLQARLPPYYAKNLRLVPATLGTDAGAIGAAALALAAL